MESTLYPLLFTYCDILAGNGFIAGVQVLGRASMVQEVDGDVWVYGVTPGGLSDGGASQKEAAAAFRESYRAVLFDIAAETAHFADFKAAVEEFDHDASDEMVKEWQEGVALVRRGELSLDWLDKESSDSCDFSVQVVELAIDADASAKRRPEASFNMPPRLMQAA
ncbi:MAG: hypothetical protein V3T83_13265 [Acidobacteriota bacterium]